MDMAKLLLAYGAYPKYLVTEEGKKKFHFDLCKAIERALDTTPDKAKVVRKWSLIYLGMLFLDYVSRYHQSHNHDELLKNAYDSFCAAIKLKTTRIVYFLAAKTILVFAYTPPGLLTREEAIALAEAYIRDGSTIEEGRRAKKSKLSSSAPKEKSPIQEMQDEEMQEDEEMQDGERKTLVEKAAKPPYITEIRKRKKYTLSATAPSPSAKEVPTDTSTPNSNEESSSAPKGSLQESLRSSLFVPSSSSSPEDSSTDPSEDSSANSSSDLSDSESELPSIKELVTMYPDAQYMVDGYAFDILAVRSILYFHEVQHMALHTIAERSKIHVHDVRKILRANCSLIPQPIVEQLANAYLYNYDAIETHRIDKRELFKKVLEVNSKLAEESGITPQFLEKYFKKHFVSNGTITSKIVKTVCDLYTNKQSFSEIADKTHLDYGQIVLILHLHSPEAACANPVNLELQAHLPDQEQGGLIIATFNSLQDQPQPGGGSIFLRITRSLRAQKNNILYATVKCVLKKNGLAISAAKQHELEPEDQQQIKADFDRINPQQGNIQDAYIELANRYGVTKDQVAHLVRERVDKTPANVTIGEPPLKRRHT